MITPATPQRLWDGPAPGSETWTHDEIWIQPDAAFGGGGVRNVVVPTITPFLPVPGAERAVLIAPGGAFHIVSMENEGHQVAAFLGAAGIASYVLKYRVVPTPADDGAFLEAVGAAFRDGLEAMSSKVLPLAVADAERALELLRAAGHRRVTVLGFSAGGRLVTQLLRSPRAEPLEAAAVVYTATAPDLSGVEPVPLFVAAAADDPLGIDGSLDLHATWRAAGTPAELHLFEKGGHGFGMTRQALPSDRWSDLLLAWLQSR